MCDVFSGGYLVNWIGSLLSMNCQGPGSATRAETKLGTGTAGAPPTARHRGEPLVYLISSVFTTTCGAGIIAVTFRRGFLGPESYGICPSSIRE